MEMETETKTEMETKTETATEARIYCRLVYKIVRFIYTHTQTDRHTHTLGSSEQAALPQRKTNNFSTKRGSSAKRRAEQLTGAYRGRIVTFYWLP